MTDIGPLRAWISRPALVENARRALGIGPDPIADLRRDAFGHGVGTVAGALAEAGVRRVRLDPEGTDAAAAAGLEVVDAAPTLDSRTLYGLPGGAGAPVLRLTGSLLSVKPLLAGEGVSYNYTHVAQADTRIALVSGGFGQGVLRGLGNRVSVEIRGTLHPIVGRIAMDVCVVDVGESPVTPGDEVVYFGGGLVRGALADWEKESGLTGAELVCALGLRAASLGLRETTEDAA
jgi:alanine racemase